MPIRTLPTQTAISTTNPTSYHLPLLWLSKMLTVLSQKLRNSATGEIIPCQIPAQNPAGFAPVNLYFESIPARQNEFDMFAQFYS